MCSILLLHLQELHNGRNPYLKTAAMSMSLLPSLSSSHLRRHKPLHLLIRPVPHSLPRSRISAQSFKRLTPSSSYQPLIVSQSVHDFLRYGPQRIIRGFCCKAVENGEGEVENSEEEGNYRAGESTMPERFRYLTKEAPEPPVRWPWVVASAFLIYAWRAVLFELSNWRKGVFGILHFVGYVSKFFLALIFYFIGHPITSLIRFIETTIYTVRAFYSSIVAYAPVPELTLIIILVSFILSIAETTVPNSVNSQQYLLTFSGLIGYSVLRGFLSEPFFYTLLVGIYGFSRLIKKRDDVSATLPVAALLVGVGDPWVRILVVTAYLALAITHHSKNSKTEKDLAEVSAEGTRVPLPLLGVALAIGIHVAAKWAGYRHLTWMIA